MTTQDAMTLRAFARTDVGQIRQGNEDDYFVGHTTFAVADGMGGHAAGEVASRTALEPVAALDGRRFSSAEEIQEALAQALRDANQQVVAKARAEPELQGMGTTLTAAMVHRDRLHIAHVGDSRAYLLRAGDSLSQLTTDHTLVERLVREGRLSRAEAATHPQRNVITRAIGNEREVVIDSLPPLRLEPGDQILLCSDGLTGPVDDDEIAAVLQHEPDGEQALAVLVDKANEAGGPDNITAVLLRAESELVDDAPAPSEGAAEAPTDGATTAPLADASIRRIRTRRDAADGDWASSLGRYGAPQGVSTRTEGAKGRARSTRVFAALLGVLLLLGVLGGGGWMLASRAYFVGSYEGQVAIFRGIPQEIGNLPLHQVIEEEVTDLPLSTFPQWRQAQIEDGLTASDLEEARRYVANLEATVDDADEEERTDDEEEGPGGDEADGEVE